jgi:hypothetical protein
MIDRVDDVCARLALNGQDDRRLVIVPAVLRDVLRADNSAPNVANPNGRAASESNDLVIEALRCLELVIRVEQIGLLLAVKLTLRLDDGDRRKCRPKLFEI